MYTTIYMYSFNETIFYYFANLVDDITSKVFVQKGLQMYKLLTHCGTNIIG